MLFETPKQCKEDRGDVLIKCERFDTCTPQKMKRENCPFRKAVTIKKGRQKVPA